MKKYIALFLALVMIAACFVGCGKKEASDMAAIKKAGKIVVGIGGLGGVTARGQGHGKYGNEGKRCNQELFHRGVLLFLLPVF